MVKRVTAILFILLANIFLLVHSAAPHTHHEGFIDFTHFNNHYNGNTNHDHHDDNQDEGNDFCILKQAVFITSNSVRIESKSPYSVKLNKTVFTFFSLLTAFLDDSNAPPYLGYYHHKKYSSTPHNCYEGYYTGLRAPPAV